jgi:tRNA nucleotidyltransferase/poly(A) polymerase
MKSFILKDGKIFLEKPEYFTIRAKWKGVDADFVLCRKEAKYTDGRRPDQVEVGDIYDDLARRDFTMNAIAINVDTDEVIDPYGGIQDIAKKQIKCVGDPRERFREDSLRLIRALRFSITKRFDLCPSIAVLILNKKFVDLLDNISKERIREELLKCFRHDTLLTLCMLERTSLLRDKIFKDNDLWLKPTYEQ